MATRAKRLKIAGIVVRMVSVNVVHVQLARIDHLERAPFATVALEAAINAVAALFFSTSLIQSS